VLNNHFRNVAIYAIASVMEANVVVERNVFENVAIPMRTHYEDSLDGAIREVGNLVDTASGPSDIGTESVWNPPYDYASALLPADAVKRVVDSCAGVKP
jgi:pectate lyase